MRYSFFLVVTAFSSTAFAQPASVNVDVSGVREQIAKSINVPAERIPVSVQVPAEVAADVCKLSLKTLTAQEATGGANCAAKSTSSALNAAVQQRLKS
jgi:hypothetical protein